METLIDLLPITIAIVFFAFFWVVILFIRDKTTGAKNEEYCSLKNTFFESIPKKEILTPEDFTMLRHLISSSDTQRIQIILSKNIIEEKAHDNKEVQFQLKIFTDKTLKIIESMDTSDENRSTIITECKKLFYLYASDETKLYFKDKKILSLKY